MRARRWAKFTVAAGVIQRRWRKHSNFLGALAAAQAARCVQRLVEHAHGLLAAELGTLEERCAPPEANAKSNPGLRALALIRGRVIDACAERLRRRVAAEATAASPARLTLEAVRRVVAEATMGIFDAPPAVDLEVEE